MRKGKIIMEINNIFTIKNLIIYLVAINLIAFLAMLIDKKKAEKGKWRTKEATLLTLALIGGSIGEIIGMYVFHHKTKHWYFVLGMPVILILQVVVGILKNVY